MAVQYKQKCSICRKNYVMTSARQRFRICYECQKKDMEGEVKDPQMKKMFDIPDDYYKESNFLRNIKINYMRYGSLTDKQIEAFKNVVKEIEEKKKEA